MTMSRSSPRLRIGLVLVAALFCGRAALGEAVDYVRDIRPILQQRCYACHSRNKQESQLRLDAGALVHKGGKHGPVLSPVGGVPGELVRRITATEADERMPKEGRPLDAEEIAKLRAWVASGAVFPKDEPIPVAPAEHWAFQPVRRPPVPSVKDHGWPRNPIDRFVLARLEDRGWKPAPVAAPGRCCGGSIST